MTARRKLTERNIEHQRLFDSNNIPSFLLWFRPASRNKPSFSMISMKCFSKCSMKQSHNSAVIVVQLWAASHCEKDSGVVGANSTFETLTVNFCLRSRIDIVFDAGSSISSSN